MTYANDMPTTEKVVRTDAGLASELRLSVMRLRRRLAAERDPDNPLSMGQMAVLGALYRNGDQSIGELAAHERVQPPSMTRTVNCLEEGGYVTRRPHETGRTVLLADRARRDEWLARRLAGLTADERAALRRATPILQRLAQAD
jgi:DNA-binding MarR family transcriptional regulator